MKLDKEFLEELSKLKPIDWDKLEKDEVEKLIEKIKKDPSLGEKIKEQFKLKPKW